MSRVCVQKCVWRLRKTGGSEVFSSYHEVLVTKLSCQAWPQTPLLPGHLTELKQSLTNAVQLAWNSLCSPDWPKGMQFLLPQHPE